ncbi:MAG: DUF423 domain-containing protein [Verrucomicrobia bacterium]|nr:DUF423 domain-containing protein [Verrucomicrobiota bacterium]
MTARLVLLIAGLFGGIAVVLGAFGAHGLRARLEPSALAAFETGVRYQMYHAIVLLWAGLWMLHGAPPILRGAVMCFTIGTVLFSGSIYLLATRTLLPLGELRFLGPVTPVGGLLLIVGWSLLVVAALRMRA